MSVPYTYPPTMTYITYPMASYHMLIRPTPFELEISEALGKLGVLYISAHTIIGHSAIFL